MEVKPIPIRDVLATSLKPGNKIMHQGQMSSIKQTEKPQFIAGVPRVRVTLDDGSTITYSIAKKITIYA